MKERLSRGKNQDYWIRHIEEIMERDHKVDQELASLDWTVIRFWGEDIKKDLDGCEKVIEETIFEKKQSYKPRMFIQQMRKHSVNAPIFYFF